MPIEPRFMLQIQSGWAHIVGNQNEIMRLSIVRRMGLLTVFSAGVFCNAVAKADERSTTNTSANAQTLEDSFLFYPSKYPQGNWHPTALKFQDVWFVADDGTRLHGWYCPCKDPRATILLVHGNGGNVSTRASWLQYLQTRLRVTAFVFDYRDQKFHRI